MDELMPKVNIVSSRTNLPVPIINEVHLHSIYAPLKEAKESISKIQNEINKNNKFLVLGLGFAYHVEELIRLCNSKNVEVYVIESNPNLIESFLTYFNHESSFKIKHYSKVEDYFFDLELVEFMSQNPYIIQHEPSIHLNLEFYRNFLKKRPCNKVKEYKHLLSPAWRDYFADKKEDHTLRDSISEINKTKNLKNKNDFLIIALNEIAHTNSGPKL